MIKVILYILFSTLVIGLNLSPCLATEKQQGLIIVGDTGDDSADKQKVADAMVKYCQKELCSMGLLLGDNFYQHGVDDVNDPQFKSKFEEPYKNLRFKFFPVLGNHDARGNTQAQIDYVSKHWSMPGRYYQLDRGWLQLYALDTNDVFDHINWLETEIDKHKGQARWTIVYGHHPVYSDGVHGDGYLQRMLLQPVLETKKVDFYFSGHDHNKQVIERNNTNYIVVGTGAKVRPITALSDDSIFARSSLGFVHLLLSKTKAVLRFIDQDGKIEFEKIYTK